MEGLVYLLIPIGYACLFVFGLAAAIVLSFSRTRRHIADYLLLGTVMTMPGIVLAWVLLILFGQWADGVPDGPRPHWIDTPIRLAIFLMPFLIAFACVAGSFWFGASLAIRRRQRKRRRPAT